MEVELLHIHHGDKKKTIDTTKPEGKNEVDRLFKNLCEQKCAIFLERGKKSYRIVGYDKESDQLIVENPGRVNDRMKVAGRRAVCRVGARAAKVAAVAPVAGGSDDTRPAWAAWLVLVLVVALWGGALWFAFSRGIAQ